MEKAGFLQPLSSLLSVVQLYQPVDSLLLGQRIASTSCNYITLPLMDVFLETPLKQIIQAVAPYSSQKIIDITVPFGEIKNEEKCRQHHLSRILVLDKKIIGIKLCTEEMEIRSAKCHRFQPWPKEKVRYWSSKEFKTSKVRVNKRETLQACNILSVSQVLNWGQRKRKKKHKEKEKYREEQNFGLQSKGKKEEENRNK